MPGVDFSEVADSRVVATLDRGAGQNSTADSDAALPHDAEGGAR